MTKLKASEVAGLRANIAKVIPNCPLCGVKFTASNQPVLDHDHKTGFIRDCLCRNCNGMEGKIENRVVRAARGASKIVWLRNLLNYWVRHEEPRWGGVLHPTHQTENEKRLKRNRLARERRAKLTTEK